MTPSTMPADAPADEVETFARRVACDGDGALGHPRVFLTMENGVAECPYCGRRFVAGSASAGRG